MSNMLGTVPGWITVCGVVALIYILARGGAPGAVRGLREVNEVLERQLKDAHSKIVTLEQRVHDLEQRTDIALAVTPVLDAMAAHETRAAERSRQTLIVLNMIAGKLGPE